MVDAAFERQQRHVIVHIARAFGENNQRRTFLQRGGHLLRNGFGIVAVAHNQQAVEYIVDDETSEFAFEPIIRTGHRTRQLAPFFRQGNPHHDKVAVAGVVSKIDLFFGGKRNVAFEFGAHTGDERDEKIQNLVNQPSQQTR